MNQNMNQTKIVKILGIDIAKNVFHLHGVDENDKQCYRRKLQRSQLLREMANIPPCLIGMESCGSSHYFGRELTKLGHTVKLMAGKYVKPYRMNGKNDYNDSEAICEAVGRPKTRFVPIKTIEQHDIQSLHRIRETTKKMRTMQSNQLRSLLAEYGIILPKGFAKLRQGIPEILEDADQPLTMLMRDMFQNQYDSLIELDARLEEITHQIEQIAKDHPICSKLIKIPGIGALTATAYYAAIGNGHQFKCGRDASAWLGLVPKQYSSGGKEILLGITKKGNKYLRALLVHGSRAQLAHCTKKDTKTNRWLCKLKETKHHNTVVVALANKNARIAWAIIAKGEEYKEEEITKKYKTK